MFIPAGGESAGEVMPKLRAQQAGIAYEYDFRHLTTIYYPKPGEQIFYYHPDHLGWS